mmetsp:Transcript_152724/g.281488  ORF Transcript_152724/g.281488 Transcript_152724/m.281488 type:complete len:169 (+) Transcript_152724:276-782(+)
MTSYNTRVSKLEEQFQSLQTQVRALQRLMLRLGVMPSQQRAAVVSAGAVPSAAPQPSSSVSPTAAPSCAPIDYSRFNMIDSEDSDAGAVAPRADDADDTFDDAASSSFSVSFASDGEHFHDPMEDAGVYVHPIRGANGDIISSFESEVPPVADEGLENDLFGFDHRLK